jgi:RHS repeat-associated protein
MFARSTIGHAASLIILVSTVCVTLPVSAKEVTYYYTDQIGTVLATTDGSGVVTSVNEVHPYGNRALGAGDGSRFAGHVVDEAEGVVYMQARYYDRDTGRFFSVDPVAVIAGDSFAFNRYVYGNANPISNIDPFGLTTWPGDGRVRSNFGDRERGVRSQPHQGIDIANPLGGAVRASDSGTVISITNGPGGEHQVIIQTSDGTVLGYAHVDGTVQVGDHVDEGQTIGTTDVSGHSTGPHIHYSVRPGPHQPRVDPRTHLPPRNGNGQPPNPNPNPQPAPGNGQPGAGDPPPPPPQPPQPEDHHPPQ